MSGLKRFEAALASGLTLRGADQGVDLASWILRRYESGICRCAKQLFGAAERGGSVTSRFFGSEGCWSNVGVRFGAQQRVT